jgi:hypothetical protein
VDLRWELRKIVNGWFLVSPGMVLKWVGLTVILYAQLAKLGSECPFIGPEPACGISAGIAEKAVRDWTNRGHKKYWASLTGLK